MRVSTQELRTRTREIIRALDRGESVTLLYRGKEKGILQPIASSKADQPMKMTEHPAFGMWKDREDMRDVEAYMRRIRRPRYRDL